MEGLHNLVCLEIDQSVDYARGYEEGVGDDPRVPRVKVLLETRDFEIENYIGLVSESLLRHPLRELLTTRVSSLKASESRQITTVGL